MKSVTVSRELDASPDAVRDAIRDVEPFMRAGGFDEVSVDGDSMRIVNGFAVAQIELHLDLFEATDAVLAYRQREGVFDQMETRYTVEPRGEGALVTATTDFALDLAIAGAVLDATIITRQRKKELNAQFDYLANRLEG